MAGEPAPEDLNLEALGRAYRIYKAGYDPKSGGFGGAPKFPMPVTHHLLLRYYDFENSRDPHSGEATIALDMSVQTLRAMDRGGIYDQIGGGFHRYSTDERWHVPHFEKMLYDNAQLAANFLDAFQITGDAEFAEVARGTLDYLLRDMVHPDGGFYSAEDADSFPLGGTHKTEGAFYVWEKKEIMDLLGPEEGETFCRRYGVRPEGNAQEDPHGEFPNKNILFQAASLEDAARPSGLSRESAVRMLDTGRQRLLSVRAKRPRPHLDDKILSSWNGLALSAFARACQVFGRGDYGQAAERAALFLRRHLYDEKEKRLYRRWREGDRQVPGMADDYAFLTQGLLDLYEATFDPQWLLWAEELAQTMTDLFYDSANGGFYMTSGTDGGLILRMRDAVDNVEPSAGSVAVLNLLRLAEMLDRPDFREKAERTLQASAAALREHPRAFPSMLGSLCFALSSPPQIVLTGSFSTDMLKTVHSRFMPQKTLMWLDGGERQALLSRRVPFLQAFHSKSGETEAHVCFNHACQQPVSTPQALEDQLQAAESHP